MLFGSHMVVPVLKACLRIKYQPPVLVCPCLPFLGLKGFQMTPGKQKSEC